MKYKKTLIIIILFAFFLRIFMIEQVPYGFYADEASSAYDAYSVLLTGSDRYRETFPLLFRSFDDYIPPLLNYFEVVSVFLFGLNVFAARLVPVLFGLFTVIVSFFLVKKLFNENVALIAALFLTISPWHLQYSRIVFPAITFPLLFLLGLYFFFKERYVISAFGFALTFYSYAIAKLFVPLFLVGLFFIYRKDILKKSMLSFLIFLFVFSLPAVYTTVFDEGQQRFSDLSIFREGETESFVILFFNNYISYFSLDFLFLNGDSNVRHSLRDVGQLYWFDLPFVLIGLILFLWRRTNTHKLMLWWLIIYPVAASLTIATGHATRTINAIPLFQIMSAYGVYWLYGFVKGKKLSRIVLSMIIILIVGNFSFYAYNYFIEYPNYSRDAFEAEIGNALAYVKSVKDNYDEIDLTYAMDQPYIYVLFYNQFDPIEYQLHGLDNTKYKIDYIGTLYDLDKNALYIAKSFELKDLEEKKVFYYNDGQVAFRII